MGADRRDGGVMDAVTVTGSNLADRSRAILASARRWAHEGERLALLADELNDAPDEDYAPFSVEVWVDIGVRARGIASDVRELDADPELMLDAARELVAVIDFFTERAAAEEAAHAG
jgi:hypothetical protein